MMQEHGHIHRGIQHIALYRYIFIAKHNCLTLKPCSQTRICAGVISAHWLLQNTINVSIKHITTLSLSVFPIYFERILSVFPKFDAKVQLFLIYARLCHKMQNSFHITPLIFHFSPSLLHFAPYTIHFFRPFRLKIKIFIHFFRNYLRIWEFLLTFALEFTPKPRTRWLDVGSLHIDWRLLTLCI